MTFLDLFAYCKDDLSLSGKWINVTNLKQVFISHGDCIEDAQYVAEKVKQKYGVEDIIIQDICPTIGAHTAQGAVVVAYMGNSR